MNAASAAVMGLPRPILPQTHPTGALGANTGPVPPQLAALGITPPAQQVPQQAQQQQQSYVPNAGAAAAAPGAGPYQPTGPSTLGLVPPAPPPHPAAAGYLPAAPAVFRLEQLPPDQRVVQLTDAQANDVLHQLAMMVLRAE
jgi:hypothetical protein